MVCPDDVGKRVWAIFYSLELSSNSLDEMLFWINYEYIGIGSIPALWILFVVHYIGKKEWLNGRSLIAIFFFPIVVSLTKEVRFPSGYVTNRNIIIKCWG
jgi:hypothetical protein